MPDPLSAIAIAEMLKKLIGIFSDRLAKKIFDRSDPRREVLRDLHTELGSLELALVHLGDILGALQSSKYDTQDLNFDLTIALRRARESLVAIQTQVEILEPGLSIMADDVVPDVVEFYNDEVLIITQLGLTRRSWSPESAAAYQERITGLLKQAQLARKSVANFVRKTYTWQDFRNDIEPDVLKMYQKRQRLRKR